MINKDELLYKLDAVISYLKSNGGYDYKVYDRLCPDDNKPDSNIVEYALDVKDSIEKLFEQDNLNITEKDLPF